ncbi:MAG: CDP-diacylglycerol--serine O-phosphatidyltransferase [Gammaproteobacteria bacterium]|nr:CDP-diacylglycerol--serine O-phosphatidyltransferase [Gammaproteobacteria bacterium]MCD8543118.1 CDP-diacylglycerol--serine O-phosphatidyltransferase [Gammaproteobacteria bacterium]
MPEEVSIKPNPKRGIYLLPNIFTTAALFAAFYAIIAAMQHHFSIACVATFIAMIADGLDGRVARLTNTQSAFGAEYDSLSDMVAFGLSPAFILYTWSLNSLGKIGWLCAFFYVACTALRLARFNTQLDGADKRFFIGLACPAAAAVLVGAVWFLLENTVVLGKNIAIPMALLTVVVGILQVSNIKYYSFKVLDFRSHVPFTVLIFTVILVMLVALDPAQVLFYAFSLYVVLGPVIAWNSLRKDKKLVTVE